MFIFFFFSSRRRHTRYWRDWSSDVCSSDLLLGDLVHGSGVIALCHEDLLRGRSEERRVGKECRSRWSPYHSKKKITINKKGKRLDTKEHPQLLRWCASFVD